MGMRAQPNGMAHSYFPIYNLAGKLGTSGYEEDCFYCCTPKSCSTGLDKLSDEDCL